MRDIKFRVWDTDYDKYDRDFTLSSDGCVCASWGKNKPEWILEQYTGLKDKNGREIYEGDIVTHSDSEFPAKVMYDDDHAIFILIEKVMGFTFDWASDYEVIGNIHENPELMKE